MLDELRVKLSVRTGAHEAVVNAGRNAAINVSARFEADEQLFRGRVITDGGQVRRNHRDHLRHIVTSFCC